MTSRSESTPAPGFVDLEKLKDAYGIVCIISQRTATGALTFGIFKEFERDGQNHRSTFVGEHLIDAYMDMVAKAKDRIQEIRDKNLAPITRDGARVRPPRRST